MKYLIAGLGNIGSDYDQTRPILIYGIGRFS